MTGTPHAAPNRSRQARLVAALVVTVLVVAVGFAVRPRKPALPPDPTGNQALIDTVTQLDPPGHRLAVVVVDPDGSVRSAYWGGATADTRFEVGSVSKAITALAIADSVGRGELDLDDPLGRHLDVGGSPAADVTMRELVTHSSGLPRLAPGFGMLWDGWWATLTAGNPYRGDVTVLRDHAAGAELGDKNFAYSNLGAALAGQAAASAAGLSYPAYLHDRVIAPLGLRDTAVQTEQAPVSDGFDLSGRAQEPWVLDGDAPAGGVVSTPHELTTVAQRLLAGDAPGQSALDPLAPTDDDEQIGMFWFVRDLPDGSSIEWHNGATGGYSSYLAVDRTQGRAVIVLADVTGTATPIGEGLVTDWGGDR